MKKEIIKLVPSIKNLLMVGACHAKSPRHRMYCRLGLAYLKDVQVAWNLMIRLFPILREQLDVLVT